VEVPDRRPDATLRHRLRVLYPEAPGRRLKQWLAGGRVRVNGVVVRRGDVPVGRDDRIELGRPAVAFPSPLRLVYEDEHLLVVDKPAGLLTIGSLETTAALRLSPILSAYVAAYPEVDLVLRTGTSAELIAQVLEQRLEGAFVCGPVEHPELDAEVVFREELVLVTARGWRTLAALFGRPDLKLVVLRAGCSYRQRLESILAARGIVGARRLEFGTLDAILGCVAAGLGVTLLPRSVAAPAWRGGQVAIHALPPAEARVETLFVRRRDAFVSSALAAFLRSARSGLAALTPRARRAYH